MKTRFLMLLCLITLSGYAQSELTLEDIFASRKYVEESIDELRSMKDGEHYTILEDDYIIKFNYKSGKVVDTIFKKSIPAISSYEFSADESKILLFTQTEHVYRHSTREFCYVFDVKNKKFTPLSENGKQSLATFSPTSDKIGFVRDNNLFYKDLTTNNEVQITKDGKRNNIINGAPDWVYEEEFSFTKGFQWSADGKKLAFYKFDESEVKEFSMDMYGGLYPEPYKYKYPKVGQKNSVVSIHIYDVATNNTIPVNLGAYEYIPRIQWTNQPATLSVQTLNRHQDELNLYMIDAQTGKGKAVLTEQSKTYIDVHDNLTFLKNKNQFIWSSEQDGFNHLYLYDMQGGLIQQITKGEWEVLSFKGIDEKSSRLYYTSSQVSPMEKHLYSVQLNGSGAKKLTSLPGTHAIEFSVGLQYFVDTYSNANTPSSITLHAADGKQIRVLKDNEALNALFKNMNFSKKEFFTFKTSENVLLNGWMIKPADFNSNQKYPVFMFVYGGPGSQTVEDEWGGSNYLWYQYLAKKGYLVVSIDNRGTGARGAEFKKCTYKNLGNLETQDQIEGAKYLGSLPYVDKNRIGIQGWSYGGYMASLCITKGADYFKAGIAVAPVNHWKFYDSIYTERYMQTTDENKEGYENGSPIKYADKLKGKYLLMHGTADDNVHFQNSVEMVSALQKANKQFDFMLYPDKSHGISGGKTRLNVYTKMTDFILENL